MNFGEIASIKKALASTNVEPIVMPKCTSAKLPTRTTTTAPKKEPAMQQNFKNRTLFHGDNLDFLRAMNSESIDLIATDPPFNKGKDFHATPDSLAAGAKFQDRWTWERDVHEEWVDLMQDDHPKVWQAIQAARNTHSESMAAFCCFLGVRLVEMHRILKPSGSIYLHCDATANSYIRMLFDAVFGAKNHRNEIVWSKYGGSKNNAVKKMPTEHDTIYYYTKTSDFYFVPVRRPLSEATIKGEYKYTDEDGRLYAIPRGRSYLAGKPKRVYLDENPGATVGTLWTEKAMNIQGKDNERTGYPTQKPIALYSRIIQASCPEKGWVLDPFAGCATTCVAAEKLDRKWVGIDLWDEVAHVTNERLANECDDLFRGKVTFTSKQPKRTDDGDTASVYIKTPMRRAGECNMTKALIKIQLIEELGIQCQGCNREFDTPEYLELDHKWPKSEGGTNAIENRTLLCGPCNRRKSNKLTLTQLTAKNKKEGFMAR